MLRHYDVIIIGAGASGLAACKEMEANGITSILILEASDRTGGRVKTVWTPDGFIEYGAQWIHGTLGNALYEIGTAAGLISSSVSVDGEGDFYSDKGEKLDKHLVKEMLNLFECIKEEGESFASNSFTPPPSIGHYFRARFNEHLDSEGCTSQESKLKEALYHWSVRWERIDNACDSMHQLSCKRWGEYIFCDGFDNLNPSKGMISLLSKLKDSIKSEVKLQSEVVKIDYATRLTRRNAKLTRVDSSLPPVVVTCKNGDVYWANHVMVTSSNGYLKKHKEQLFYPPLPLPMDMAISSIGFGVIDKIFLEFKVPFWDKDLIGIHLVWTDDQIPDFDRTVPDTRLIDGRRLKMEHFWYRAISGFDPVFGHHSMLCGWISGPEAEFMEALPEQEVARTCVWLLRKFTNNKNIPEPVAIYRTQWSSYEYFLGSYSYKLASMDCLEKSLENDLNLPVCATFSQSEKVPVLALAGEANSTELFSTVHGALESGTSQAKHYINFVKSWEAIDAELKSV